MGNLTRFNRLMDDTFLNDFFMPVEKRMGSRLPAIDVHETDEKYLVNVDLPGINKEDIHVSMENGVLTVKGETQTEEKEEKEGKMIRRERHVGSYMRQFTVGSEVDPDAIDARFENGVLSLELKKLEKSKPNKLEIKVN
ncbi:Hsp20/alpha crystallin family protein [Neptunomonas antarctica]|uniref:Heat shock protein Hsp20 n=1 Tax=Neptunomonas antarctica TaxID=619304 RepID=A0A1N7J3X8_9GAMM|nr:Hsp20/alpha crystallin family protein [Neptunomonas antarctica]SIS43921.1 heat shock protein Hsp20 [Neptunomonas antarctica]